MAWLKVDDAYSRHPKILAAGPFAAWLDICAMAYCMAYLTDGFVPESAVATLADWSTAPCTVDVAQLVQKLVEVRRWERANGGYKIHDFLKYNPSRAEVLARREQDGERQKRGGLARARGPRDAHGRYVRGSASSTSQDSSRPAGAQVDGLHQPESSSPSPSPSPEDLELKLSSPDGDRPRAETLVQLWNETVTRLPKVQTLSSQRRQKALHRLREHPDLAWWERVFRAADTDSFMCGDNDRDWRASFDYFVKNDTNAVRILENKRAAGDGRPKVAAAPTGPWAKELP